MPYKNGGKVVYRPNGEYLASARSTVEANTIANELNKIHGLKQTCEIPLVDYLVKNYSTTSKNLWSII